MDDEQKKWRKQYSSSLGAKEYIRLSGAIVIWEFIGMAIALAIALPGKNEKLSDIIIAIFTLSIFVFPILIRWRLAYSLLRAIVGNKNLPTEPMPRSTIKLPPQPKPWFYYLLVIWNWALALLLLYLVIQYFSK